MTPFRPLLGTDNYFARWADQCAAWQIETPLPFMWLAMAVGMGHIVGYRVWIQHANPHQTYPSLSSILLSPSGICRRGGGTKIAMSITEKAGGRVLEGDITPEGIIVMLKHAELRDAALGTGARLLLYMEEMSDVINKKDSQKHLVPKLTALINRDRTYEDVKKGMMMGPDGKVREPLTITRPCLSLLATTAPDWFLTSMQRDVRSGGLMSRLVGCHLEDRELVHIDLTPQEADLSIIVADLAHDLEECTLAVNGPLYISPTTNKWFQTWYTDSEAATRLMPDGDPRTIRVRRHENALKIGMLFAIAHKDQEVKQSYIEQGIAIVEYMEPTMDQFYSWTEQMEHTLGRGEKRVLDVLRRNGDWTKHSVLLKAVLQYFKDGGVDSFRKCMRGLVESKGVEFMPKTKVATLGLNPFIEQRAWPPAAWRIPPKV